MGKWKHNKLLTRDFLSQSDIQPLSNKQLATQLHIDPTIIGSYRKKFNLLSKEAIKVQRGKYLRRQPLDTALIGLIVGTVLGDGHIGKSPEGSIFLTIGHGPKQQEYTYFWRQVLRNLCVSDVYRWIDKETKEIKSYSMITICNHPDIVGLHSLFYDATGKKIVTQRALDLLTIPGLVVWFFDDGCRQSNCYYLHTCSFSLEEHKLIRKHLFKKFGIKTSIIRTYNGKSYYWSLYFAKETRSILEGYLIDFQLPYFRYKIHPSLLSPSETIREDPWKFFLVDKI
jgi:hypothetical protein